MADCRPWKVSAGPAAPAVLADCRSYLGVQGFRDLGWLLHPESSAHQAAVSPESAASFWTVSGTLEEKLAVDPTVW